MNDADLIQQFRKHFTYRDGLLYRLVAESGQSVGAVASHVKRYGYAVVSMKNKRYLAHRVIFALHHGHLPAALDHINGNRSDNHIENLRAATQSQNLANQRVLKGSCGFKGVRRARHGYQADCGGKYVGYFAEAEDAAAAYDAKAVELFGEFAVTNRMLGLIC